MELKLSRIAKKATYTIGRLYIENTYFCDTLEPTWRNVGNGRPGQEVPAHTQGCILPGENKSPGQVWNSRLYVKLLIALMTEAKEAGESIWITVE